MNLTRRRWPALLLWLALALLPLRGWAEATMPLMMALGGGGAGMQTAKPLTTAVMPCHAAATMGDTIDVAATNVDPADPSDLATSDSASPEHNACSLCDLCHGSVAGAPRAPSVPAAAPAVKPLPDAAMRVEPAVLSGPERPPRPTTL